MTRKILLNLLPHAAAIVIFVVLASAYFSPVWSGYELRQGDIDQWRGMSKEIFDYRLLNEDEPLWTNSMFGGMPAFQISTEHNSNLLRPVMLFMRLGLPGPVGTLFLAMLGFYIFALCLRINPWLAIAGSIAFGFSTINILYLGAGHTAKVAAIALMPPVLGGLILAFRGKIILGASVFMLFLGLQISANHLQMTYYLAILCGAVAVGETIRLLIQKSFGNILRSGAALLAGAGIAVLPGMSNLMTTQNYSKYTTRGESDLTITPDGAEKNKADKTGLDTDYILDYNFAKGEQWSLLIPNAKGGQSAAIGNNKEVIRKVDRQFRDNIAQQNQYWGAQRFTGGAFYFGALTMILFALGLIFIKDAIKWPFLVLTLLALGLCLKEVSSLNNLFIHSFPLYNKFRDSKMILVIIQVIAPVTAILFIQQIIRGELWTSDKKYFFISSAAILLILGTIAAKPSVMGSYLSADEQVQFDEMAQQAGSDGEQLAMLEDFQNSLQSARMAIFKEDAVRTFLFALAALAIVAAVWFKVARELIAGSALAVFMLADEWNVDQRYLSNSKERIAYRNYVKAEEKIIPHQPSAADEYILAAESPGAAEFEKTKSSLLSAMKADGGYSIVRNKDLLEKVASFGALGLSSDYRVLALSNPFNDAGTSYYHKSIGGYHGAKLKRYQEMIDFHIQNELALLIDSLKAGKPMGVLPGLNTLNMLNTKYLVYNPEAAPIQNPYACGNAWFVDEVVYVKTPDDEVLKAGQINPATQAVAREEFKGNFSVDMPADSSATVTLDKYEVNKLSYTSNSNTPGAVVFSEIYYPDGWICKVDGQETPYVCVNHILRGINVPAGKHAIEWTFEPTSWKTGSTISFLGSSLLILLVLGSFAWAIRQSYLPKS